ncbi:MAG: polyisoprenoid-binding protein [Methylophilaceae bacterium 17-44-8]|nr:MAG: polyisoprenoid-binding protein [Methylophilales bacterium 28-44-11]OYZ06059.1 MAG: polyisoprenoid-binding protein [Methylophilales bacterium 16-45-7]OZA04946.1 MAG: polyisoprenoid-binding protein [Methylophilaceae bacterium 17-44-8]
MKQLLMALGLALSTSAFAATETYNIDAGHSFANFSIRHVVAKTTGSFNDVTGLIKIDRDNLTNSSVNAKIAVASVSTRHAKRDEHIQKPDYLDAVQFGEMTFFSTKVEAKSATEGVMTGQLTLHGVTKEIQVPFKVLGFGADPWGGQRAGFEGHTLIKASDYGFAWMKKPNSPVGDEVEITLLIEGVKAK